MQCPNCNHEVPMQLIKGDYGVWLMSPYWKCFYCMKELPYEKRDKEKDCGILAGVNEGKS